MARIAPSDGGSDCLPTEVVCSGGSRKTRKVRDYPVTLKRPATMENKRSSKKPRVGRRFLWAALLLIAIAVAHRSSEPEFRMVSGWRRSLEEATLGDVSGVGFDQNGDIVIFHRGGRPWLADPVPSVFGIGVRLTFRFGLGCSGIAQEADGGKNGSAAATSAGHGPAGGLRIAAKKYFFTSRQKHRKGGARPRRGFWLRPCRRFDSLRVEVARTHRTAAGVEFFRKPLLASLVMY